MDLDSALYKAMTDMYFQKRYRKAFIIIDTCQSASLIPKVLVIQ